MKFCQITVSSKNKRSINEFHKFFFNVVLLKFNLIKKYFYGQQKRKLVSILKSPHVNKTAQEQFELNTYFRKYFIYLDQPSKFVYLLKKIKLRLFSDLKFIFKYRVSDNEKKFSKIILFNPDNAKIGYKTPSVKSQRNFWKNKNKQAAVTKASRFIKFSSIHGEVLFVYNV